MIVETGQEPSREEIEQRSDLFSFRGIIRRAMIGVEGVKIGAMASIAAYLQPESGSTFAPSIAGILILKSLLRESTKSSDTTFWINFFANTGIAIAVITHFSEELVSALILTIDRLVQIYGLMGVPEPFIQVISELSELPVNTQLMLVFILLFSKPFGSLLRKYWLEDFKQKLFNRETQ